MSLAGFGCGPAIPYFGDFAETNVRLYSVDEAGRHGVVFRSLEASRLIATLGARLVFTLPYTWARMRISEIDDTIDDATSRRWFGRTLWIPNHHEPWPLQHAYIEHLDDTLVAAAGLPGVVDSAPDSVLYSAGVRTVFGTPTLVQA